MRFDEDGRVKGLEFAMPMMKFIDEYWLENAQGPSYRDISVAFDTSTSYVAHNVEKLREAGMLRPEYGGKRKSRALVPVWVMDALNRWRAG